MHSPVETLLDGDVVSIKSSITTPLNVHSQPQIQDGVEVLLFILTKLHSLSRRD